MAVDHIGSFTWAASGQSIVPGSSFATKGRKGNGYLKQLALRVEVTDIDTGAGSAFTQAELHDQAFSNVTMEIGGGGYLGPQGLSGIDLTAVYVAATGRVLHYWRSDGDAQVAASASNATRQLLYVYDYGAYGAKISDYSPPAEFVASRGRLMLNYPALTTDVTAYAATVDVFQETIEADEARAVPLIVTQRQPVPNLIGWTLGGGLLLQCLVKNAAQYANDDISGATLNVDSIPVVADAELDWQVSQYMPGSDAFALTQQHFISQIGTATSLFLPLYPPQPGRPAGKLHAGENWKGNFRGSETAGNLTFITTMAQPLNESMIGTQLKTCGCSGVQIAAAIQNSRDILKSKTDSKMPLTQKALAGYLAVKVDDTALAETLGVGIPASKR